MSRLSYPAPEENQATASASGQSSESNTSYNRGDPRDQHLTEAVIDVNELLKLEEAEAKRKGEAENAEKTADEAVNNGQVEKKKWWRKGAKESTKKAEEETENNQTVGNFFKILSYGTPLDRFMQVLGSIAALGSGAALPLIVLPFGELATALTKFMSSNGDISPADFRRKVNSLCLFFIYLFIGKLISGYICLLCFRTSGTRISARIRLRYLECLFSQPIDYFDTAAKQKTKGKYSHNRAFGTTGGGDKNQSGGAIVVAITSSANAVQEGISERLGLFIQYLSMLTVAFAVAFTKNWELTLVTGLIIPASILAYGTTVPMDIALEKKVIKAFTAASTIAQETLSTIRTVKAFNAQNKLTEKYAYQLNEAKKIGLTKTPITAIQSSAAFFIIYAGYALSFWYGVRMYQHGRIQSVGQIFSVFFAVLMSLVAIANISPALTAVTSGTAASAAMFEVIDASKDLVEKRKQGRKLDEETGEVDPGTGKKWSSRIEFRNISFSYPSRPDVRVLKDLNVVFEEGKTTAIVGSSGSGKSTIVGLLERWYDPGANTSEKAPDNGQILVNGDVDIRDLNVGWWRSQIGLVQQEPVLFNDTIYKNVCYGLVGSPWENADEEEKRRRVTEACVQANAAEFIDKLPHGYDTKVGEQGIKLSGGQKQRVAIARSIIKQPCVMILDEATSAIDPRNERIVQEALDKVSKSRTTILIAHRLSTVKKADKIVVMGSGNIIEEGTHEELLEIEGGAYRRLVEGQMLLMDREGVAESANGGDDEWEGMDLERMVTTKSIGGNKEVVFDVGDAKLTEHQKQAKKIGTIRCIALMLYEQRKHWFFYALAVISSILGGGAFPAQAIMFAKFTSAFGQSGSMADLVKTGNFWALMFFVLALSIFVTYGVLGASYTQIQHLLTAAYRLEYFESMARQSVSFFDKDQNSTGSLTSLLNTDPSALQEMLGTNLGMMLVAVVSLVSCSILALVVGWKLSLVVLAVGLPLVVTATTFRVKIELSFEDDTAAVFAESSQFASEAINAFRTVTSLTLEDLILERYRILLDNHLKRAFRKARIWMWFFAGSESVNFLSNALAFWYGCRLVSFGEYTVYQFFVVFIALVQGSESAGQFFGFSPNIAQAKAAAHRILALREDAPPPPGVTPIGAQNQSDEGCEVEFNNVYFKYPSRDTPVFKNLSLKIEKGQFIAFVGPSGCGKTTTISLLERFYDATSGEILIDGQNIKDLDIMAYRQMASLVSQEPTLYQGSILDNVLIGAPTNSTEEDVINVCKLAYIHEFISSLPEGYQTQVGTNGVGLSGGQKQRIAIARALIRNPKLLLLDEATSSLDSNSEKLVQMSLEQARSGRTIIAVAHRLSTVQKADLIFVFGDGRIVEKGNHAELIRRRGIYYQMCKGQLLDK